MFSLKARSGRGTAAGITLSKEGLALAIVNQSSISPVLEYCQYYPCPSAKQPAMLAQLAKQYKLDHISCNLVLLPEEYQLLQADAPEVPKHELAAALRWQIKDLIDFHIDDAVIDHIDLPNKNTSGKAQLLVVTSRQSTIQAHVDTLVTAGINLATIDIAVQATRNIIAQLDSTETSIGLLNLWDDIAKISVILNNDIYINRISSIGLQSLQFISEDNSSSQAILDSLALELQRTFDYYESHSRQAAITQLIIVSNDQAVSIEQQLQQRLGINCINLDMRDVITIKDDIKIDNKNLVAIGGALRSQK